MILLVDNLIKLITSYVRLEIIQYFIVYIHIYLTLVSSSDLMKEIPLKR